MQKTKFGLPPIVNSNCKILILGTFPSEESLTLKQYYAFTNNSFWKLIFEITGEKFTSDYETKKQILLRNNTALWDVIYSCEREGSRDDMIKNEKPNNFDKLFHDFPNLSTVVLTSGKTKEFFNRYVTLVRPKKIIEVTSPSSLNSHYTFEEKAEKWSAIKPFMASDKLTVS